MGRFDPTLANHAAYGGLVHGIASPAKPPQPLWPQRQPHKQQHRPNPKYTFRKALGAIQLTLDTQGTVCLLCSNVDLGSRCSRGVAQSSLLERH